MKSTENKNRTTNHKEKKMKSKRQESARTVNYYICVACLLNTQKKLMMPTEWEDHCHRDVDPDEYRSLTRMQMAAVPHEIRYARLGEDRFLEIEIAVENHSHKTDDLIDDFITKKKLR